LLSSLVQSGSRSAAAAAEIHNIYNDNLKQTGDGGGESEMSPGQKVRTRAPTRAFSRRRQQRVKK